MDICIVGVSQIETILTLHKQNVPGQWEWPRAVLIQNSEPSSRTSHVNVFLSQGKVFIAEPLTLKAHFYSGHACSRYYLEDKQLSPQEIRNQATVSWRPILPCPLINLAKNKNKQTKERPKAESKAIFLVLGVPHGAQLFFKLLVSCCGLPSAGTTRHKLTHSPSFWLGYFNTKIKHAQMFMHWKLWKHWPLLKHASPPNLSFQSPFNTHLVTFPHIYLVKKYL